MKVSRRPLFPSITAAHTYHPAGVNSWGSYKHLHIWERTSALHNTAHSSRNKAFPASCLR